jgi:hypothetical protein
VVAGQGSNLFFLPGFWGESIHLRRVKVSDDPLATEAAVEGGDAARPNPSARLILLDFFWSAFAFFSVTAAWAFGRRDAAFVPSFEDDCLAFHPFSLPLSSLL